MSIFSVAFILVVPLYIIRFDELQQIHCLTRIVYIPYNS